MFPLLPELRNITPRPRDDAEAYTIALANEVRTNRPMRLRSGRSLAVQRGIKRRLQHQGIDIKLVKRGCWKELVISVKYVQVSGQDYRIQELVKQFLEPLGRHAMDVDAPEDATLDLIRAADARREAARARAVPRVPVNVGTEFIRPEEPDELYQVTEIGPDSVMYCSVDEENRQNRTHWQGPLSLEEVRGMILANRRRGG